MDSVTIGLDIGSSAIRAAEVVVSGEGQRTLRRYAQVGLPAGYVVDGEINNIPGVAAALKRLWAEGGFSTNQVVLGVSGPRVFVRQADVPALSKDELRSSLRFDAQELVPIPMDDASFDFSVLDPSAEGGGGSGNQRILLVAAHRDVLLTNIATLKEAGLTAKVMDAAPLALMRAVPESTGEDRGVEVIVSIGAELTTVAVRQGGVPRFIRSLTIGGAKLTESIANGLHVEVAVAERLKRGGIPETPQASQAREAMSAEVRALAEEVRATIDFFVSQADGAEVQRLLVTGGASRTSGLANSIAGSMSATVLSLDPLARLDTSRLGYGPEDMSRIALGATTAVGLALWPTDSPLIRLSVLPEEVRQANRARRVMLLSSATVAAVAVALGMAGAAQVYDVHRAQAKVVAARSQDAALTAQVSKLMATTAVHTQMEAQAAVVRNDLKGDVDWVRVLGQLASVMPPSLSLTTFNGSRTVTAGNTPAAAAPLGTVSFNVTGSGGLPSTAAWLRNLESDPDLQDINVGVINVKTNGGPVTFPSTAILSPVSQSGRAKGI